MALWSSAFQFATCALLPALVEMTGFGAGMHRSSASSSDNVPKPEVFHLPKSCLRRWTPYVLLSVFMFASATAANHAVNFVDYTVKVVAKASKLLPTMATAPLLGNSASFS